MSWITITAIAVAALLVLNSATVMWRRRGRGQTAWPATIGLRKPLTPAMLALYAAFILALLIGLFIRTTAPESGLAMWIGEHGLLVYVGVCYVAMVAAGIVAALFGRARQNRDVQHAKTP